jgi:hypothetical protein
LLVPLKGMAVVVSGQSTGEYFNFGAIGELAFAPRRYLPPGVELQEHDFTELKQAYKEGRISIENGIPCLDGSSRGSSRDNHSKLECELDLVRQILALAHRSLLAERRAGIPSLKFSTEKNLNLILADGAVSVVIIDKRWDGDVECQEGRQKIPAVIGWLHLYTDSETFPQEEKDILPHEYKDRADIVLGMRLMTINYVVNKADKGKEDFLLKDYEEGLLVDALLTSLSVIAEREGKIVLAEVRSKPENEEAIKAYLKRGFEPIDEAPESAQEDFALRGRRETSIYKWWRFPARHPTEALYGERAFDKALHALNQVLSPITAFFFEQNGKILFLTDKIQEIRELSRRLPRNRVIGVIKDEHNFPASSAKRMFDVINLRGLKDFLDKKTYYEGATELNKFLRSRPGEFEHVEEYGNRRNRSNTNLELPDPAAAGPSRRTLRNILNKFLEYLREELMLRLGKANYYKFTNKIKFLIFGRKKIYRAPNKSPSKAKKPQEAANSDLSMVCSAGYFFDSRKAVQTLKQLSNALRTGGTMVLQEYCLPPTDPFLKLNIKLSVQKTQAFRDFLLLLPEEEKNEANFLYIYSSSGKTKWLVSHRVLAKFSLFLHGVSAENNSNAEQDPKKLNVRHPLEYNTLVQTLRENGLRLISAVPLAPAAVFSEGILIRDPADNALSFPATHWCIVAEKVKPGEGVEIRPTQSKVVHTPQFINIASYLVNNQEKGAEVHEVCFRPNSDYVAVTMVHRKKGAATVDTFGVVVRRYIRPSQVVKLLGGRTYAEDFESGYTLEPISYATENKDSSEEDIANEVISKLTERLGCDIGKLNPKVISVTRRFTEPGSFDDRDFNVVVEIDEWPYGEVEEAENPSGFDTPGRVTTVPMESILYGGARGLIRNAALELGCNQFCLLAEKINPQIDPWSGVKLVLDKQEFPAAMIDRKRGDLQFVSESREKTIRRFGTTSGYFDISRIYFEEYAYQPESGKRVKIATAHRGLVQHSARTELSEDRVVILPVVCDESGNLQVGVLELPSPAAFHAFNMDNEGEEDKEIIFPMLRSYGVPQRLAGETLGGIQYTIERLEKQGIFVKRTIQLGGRYPYSTGMSSGQMIPICIEVDLDKSKNAPYLWYPLNEVMKNLPNFMDANLALLSCRLFRAAFNRWVRLPKVMQ